MDYIVYKTSNNFDEKFYIGAHATEDQNIFDGYFGSGLILTSAIEKHGKENFKRETLVVCTDVDEMYSVEMLLVKTKGEDPRSYNIKPGGWGNSDLYKYASQGGSASYKKRVGYHKFTPEEKSAFSKIGGKLGGSKSRDMHVGIHDPKLKEYIRECSIIGGNKCVKEHLGWFGMADEVIAASRLNGAINGMLENKGIHTLDLEKRAEWAALGGKAGIDSIFFNDGKRNSKFIPDKNNITFEEFILQNPQYVKGKIYISKNRKTNKGKICYNDGINEFKLPIVDSSRIEEEFLEFISQNPQFVRGRLCKPFKNNPELAKFNAGSKFYTDGINEFKFFSSNTKDKELTEIEFSKFLSENKNFNRGRKPRLNSINNI